MYIELQNYVLGPARYRYIPVDITPQNFHRNRRDDAMLTVASPELISAAREEYACYGPVNVFVPDSLIYDTNETVRTSMFLNIYKWDSEFCDGCIPVLFTDDELTSLLRMRYPRQTKDPDVISSALDKYHEETNGTIMYIKIDNPPPGLTKLFENSRSGS